MNEFFAAALKRLRLLPVLIVVASLTFMVRIGDTYFEIKNMGEAQAQTADKPAEKPADPAATSIDAKKPVEDVTAAPPKEALPDPKTADAKKAVPALPATPDASKAAPIMPEKKQWQDSESDIDDSGIRKEVYDDLQQRRQQIEIKEKDLSQREALLKAGTEELNKKVEELTAIKNEIQSLLKQQSTEDAASTDRLVKIYEGMKPKDAARIFDQLDMDVLIPVVSKMSERKLSPIIAVMDATKAKNLTAFLAEQNKLPGTKSPTAAGFGDPNKPPPIPKSAVQ